jgi:hypothetical protein
MLGPVSVQAWDVLSAKKWAAMLVKALDLALVQV